VFFDMDVVLFDSERLYLDAVPLACTDLGCTLRAVWWIERSRYPGLRPGHCSSGSLARLYPPKVPRPSMQRFDELSVTRLRIKPGLLCEHRDPLN
jgi:hypothetical protein